MVHFCYNSFSAKSIRATSSIGLVNSGSFVYFSTSVLKMMDSDSNSCSGKPKFHAPMRGGYLRSIYSSYTEEELYFSDEESGLMVSISTVTDRVLDGHSLYLKDGDSYKSIGTIRFSYEGMQDFWADHLSGRYFLKIDNVQTPVSLCTDSQVSAADEEDFFIRKGVKYIPFRSAKLLPQEIGSSIQDLVSQERSAKLVELSSVDVSKDLVGEQFPPANALSRGLRHSFCSMVQPSNTVTYYTDDLYYWKPGTGYVSAVGLSDAELLSKNLYVTYHEGTLYSRVTSFEHNPYGQIIILRREIDTQSDTSISSDQVGSLSIGDVSESVVDLSKVTTRRGARIQAELEPGPSDLEPVAGPSCVSSGVVTRSAALTQIEGMEEASPKPLLFVNTRMGWRPYAEKIDCERPAYFIDSNGGFKRYRGEVFRDQWLDTEMDTLKDEMAGLTVDVLDISDSGLF